MINEHELELVNEMSISIYKRGFEDGVVKTEKINDKAYNDGYNKGYTQGLNDVWEYIKKLGKLTIGEIHEIFDFDDEYEYENLYVLAEDIGASEFIDAIKAYEIKQKKMRENCSILNDTCPYDIPCAECEVHCSITRARNKAKELKGDKE